jgi:teichuronic acid exporter
LWNYSRVFSQSVLAIMVNVVIARKLSPEEVGLAAIVFIFSVLSEILSSNGLTATFVTQKKLRRENVNTLMSVAIIYATVLLVTLWLCADYIALLFGFEVLAPMVRALSFSLWFLTLSSCIAATYKNERTLKPKCGLTFAAMYLVMP